MNLSTGAGLQAHWNPAVAERNYADAGARAYFKRVEQVGRMICTARKWEIPGGEDVRVEVEQKAMLKGARDEEVVPLLHGQSAFEEVLWVRFELTEASRAEVDWNWINSGTMSDFGTLRSGFARKAGSHQVRLILLLLLQRSRARLRRGRADAAAREEMDNDLESYNAS